MNIAHYRQTVHDGDPWEDVLINDPAQIQGLDSRALVTINGQSIIRQHSITYLTGRETCHAHHYAKMLAGAILSGSYAPAPSVNVHNLQDVPGKVLWIDSFHSIYACAGFYNEMITQFDPEHKRFSLMCLDKLGHFRYNFYGLLYHIEEAIKTIKPTLVVIDDIDHLMPFCGMNVASAVNHAIRDLLNHSEVSCLFIGYNHLGKRACTTGDIGKLLFTAADTIFSITTQQAVTAVRLVRSFAPQTNDDYQFLYAINDDNIPQEVIRSHPENYQRSLVRQNTLRDIMGDVIQPGETISPDELFQKINDRRQQLNRFDRTRALIAQAAHLGIIKKADDNSNDYTLTGSPCRDSVTTPPTPAFNNSLTLPPHPSTPSDDGPANGDAIAVPSSPPCPDSSTPPSGTTIPVNRRHASRRNL